MFIIGAILFIRGIVLVATSVGRVSATELNVSSIGGLIGFIGLVGLIVAKLGAWWQHK